jgi:two-component system, NtrC family, response regulator AtoC
MHCSERERLLPVPLDDDVVIADKAMLGLLALVQKIARAPTAVLIYGETGAGKEIVADCLHRSSTRANGPFVHLNCAAVPESLLESELFGYERGAFTGAHGKKRGLFEVADGGTLFLDEIGELSPAAQAKLLRALETRTIVPLGSTHARHVDFRIVSATHRDLQADVQAGRFRQDLFYRLNGFLLRVPPLRERPAEVVPLAELFARRFARVLGAAAAPLFDDAAIAAMLGYAWPGNVRELKNASEHAVLVCDGRPILPEHFPDAVTSPRSRGAEGGLPRDKLRERLAEMELISIDRAIAAEGGNATRAALRLGVSRGALLHKMRKHGLMLTRCYGVPAHDDARPSIRRAPIGPDRSPSGSDPRSSR